MSRLEELIKELCPDGVEYKPVKAVYKRLKGTSITAGKMKEIADTDGEIKIFAGGKTIINAHECDIPHATVNKDTRAYVGGADPHCLHPGPL